MSDCSGRPLQTVNYIPANSLTLALVHHVHVLVELACYRYADKCEHLLLQIDISKVIYVYYQERNKKYYNKTKAAVVGRSFSPVKSCLQSELSLFVVHKNTHFIV